MSPRHLPTRKAGLLAGVLAMGLAAALTAQETEPATEPDRAEPDRVEANVVLPGQVLDVEGRGLSRAEIEAIPSMTATLSADPYVELPDEGLSTVTTHTGAGGSFELHGLVPNVAYLLVARLSGYASASLVTPPLEPGKLPAVRLTLERDRGVVGRVLDAGHEPIAGATAELRSSRGVFRRAESDATGAFEITDVGSGTFTFAAWAEGYATRIADGVEIDLDAGAADLGAVHLDRGVTVSGMVTDSLGRALAGAAVRGSAPRLQTWHHGASHQTRSDTDGFFAIPNLPRGSLVEIGVFLDGYQNRTVRQVATETPLVVVMVPGFLLRGRVLDAQGHPVDRASLEIQRPDGSRESTYSIEDGSFELYRQPPGPATLFAAADEGFLGPLEVAAGAEHDQEIEIVLMPGATIDGRLADADGRSVVEAQITLDRYPPESFGLDAFFGYLGSTSSVNSRDAGRFTFSNLAAGRYRLRFEHRDFEPLIEIVELDDLASRRLDVVFRKQRAKLRVRGEVLDDRGHRVGGAAVRLYRGERLLDEVETFSDGSFHLRTPRPGVYTVTAEHAEHTEGRINELEVPPGGRRSVVLTLGGGSVVRGALRGLEVAEIFWLRVSARSPEHGERASVVFSHDAYRIPGLEAGEWTVEATLEGTTRTAAGRVTVEGTGDEVVLDLELTDPEERSLVSDL